MKRNALYKMLLNFFNLVVPFLVTPYIFGLFDKEVYGMYTRVFAEFQIAFVLGAFGIYSYGVRELSKVRGNRQKTNQLFTNLLVIGVLSNFLAGMLYVGYVLTTKSDSIEIWVYMVMLLQLVSNVVYVEFMNEVVENYRFITLKTIGIRIAYLVAIFLFVRTPADIVIYTVVVSATVLLNNVVSFLYVKRTIKLDFSNMVLWPHFFPLVTTFLLTNAELLYMQLDKVLLGPLINDVASGEYSIAVMIVGMINSLPQALVNVAIPRVSRLIGEQDIASYRQTLRQSMEVFFCLCTPMFIGLAVVAPEVIYIFDPKYVTAYVALIIAALSRMVFAYQLVITNLVMYVNHMERTLMYLLFKWGGVNVLFKVLLVLSGQFSVHSAMSTTTVALIGFCLNAVWTIRERLPFTIDFWTKRMTGYVLVSSLFWPIRQGIFSVVTSQTLALVVTMALCGLVYGGYLLLTKDPFVQYVFRRK